jgi:hypothetical protein
MNNKTNKLLILFPLIFLTIYMFAQETTLEQIDIELSKLYENVSLNKIDNENFEMHKLFREKFQKYLSNHPQSLTYNFDSLKNHNVYIVNSEDQLFRIYSWDNWTGGSMVFFDNIFQYKIGDKVQVSVKFDSSADGTGNYYPFYSKIYTLKVGNKKYYLAIGNSIFSGKDSRQSIEIFTFKNEKLNDKVLLIKTKKILTNVLNIDFDFFSVIDRPERPLDLIKYDESQKIIYIPFVTENGKITNRFILYQFKGKYFERIK